jgi:hypothetical protein
MRKLTQRIVRELLSYDEKSGGLTWRERDRRWFKSAAAWKRWNRQFANRPAFRTRDKHGYATGLLFNKSYFAHRIAFLWMTGHWPTPQTDHINGDRADNRWENLRQVDALTNARNTRMARPNRCGWTFGVYPYRRHRYCATIRVAGQLHWLGHFQTKAQAIRARKRAEKRFRFSARHGRPGKNVPTTGHSISRGAAAA